MSKKETKKKEENNKLVPYNNKPIDALFRLLNGIKEGSISAFEGLKGLFVGKEKEVVGTNWYGKSYKGVDILGLLNCEFKTIEKIYDETKQALEKDKKTIEMPAEKLEEFLEKYVVKESHDNNDEKDEEFEVKINEPKKKTQKKKKNTISLEDIEKGIEEKRNERDEDR